MTRTDAFQYKSPSPKAVDCIKVVRDSCFNLSQHLLTIPDCFERDIALQKLEEVSMWANKAAAFEIKE